MTQVWSARTGAPEEAFLRFSQSTQEDAAFMAYDVQGSLAHVKGLQQAGLVSGADSAALQKGLQELLQAFEAGSWVLDPSLEDGHMNLEAKLTSALGDVAKKLHTGRSRNDQVATCITLFSVDHLDQMQAACLALSKALADQAEAHIQTPWVAKTHAQPAQPATLGWLLLAHAFRFQDVAKKAQHGKDLVSESPLGSGAVAGSTLPLDPAYTAGLLGLRPPRNALLATGTRDTILQVLDVTTAVGHACAGLAQDLLDLFTAKAITIPAGYTTGSSLMPQKRNPDALELVRGHGHALPSHEQAVQAITAPLGLGYQRDLQLTKPHLLAACQEALGCLSILEPIVAGLEADLQVSASALETPGISATDAVEALVAHGIPFRTAYTILAEVFAAVEAGADPHDALRSHGLSTEALKAATQAFKPDVARRDTLGGPAPLQVQHALQQWKATQQALEGA